MSEKRGIAQIACVYSGTVLGAGFATGQEIVRYFLRFGTIGILGIALSGVLFSLVGYKVLYLSYKKGFTTYRELAEFLMGKTLGRVMEVVVALFLMVLFSTMLAASGLTIKTVFSIPEVYGTSIVSFLCFITFLYRVEGIVKINSVLCPILIIGGMIIGLVLYFTDSTEVFNMLGVVSENVFVSMLVYVSYNIITAVSLLITMADKIKNKKMALYSGILGGGSMALLGVCIALPIIKYFDMVGGESMPMLSLVMANSGIFRYGYILILSAAIFTTAIGNGFALLGWLESRIRANNAVLALIVCVTGLVFSKIGFVGLVGKVYMIFGYVGLLELALILRGVRE